MKKTRCEISKSTTLLLLLLLFFTTAFLNSNLTTFLFPVKQIEETASLPATSQFPQLKPRSRTHSKTCKDALNVDLLFPHVNKAGGRTLEATFGENLPRLTQYKFISSIQRSRRHKYTVSSGHRYLGEILRRRNCLSFRNKSPTRKQVLSAVENCKGKKNSICQQWIYSLRDPIMRTLSSFYTITGRTKNFVHFKCDPEGLISKRMRNISFTFEEFSNFETAERKKCYLHNQNLHLKYLTYGLIDDKSSDEEKLQFAKEILQRLDWFSILEYAEESLDLFEPELGLEILSYHSAFNYNKYEKELSKYSQKARDVLFELNYLDIELYNFAKQLLFARLDRIKPEKEIYECSRRVICWDKMSPIPGEIVTVTDLTGSKKQNTLCSKVGGCLNQNKKKKQVDLSIFERRKECIANFLIIGTRKGGSTSLYMYLSKHEQIIPVKVNIEREEQIGELFYFRDAKKKSRKGYNEAFFNEFKRDQNIFDPSFYLTGESSVDLSANLEAPKLLKTMCKNRIRVIYLVRDPVERIISQMKMRQRNKKFPFNKGKVSLEKAIENDLFQFKKKIKISKNEESLFRQGYENSIWESLYVVHLERWLKYFPKQDILVLKSEDFFQDTKNVLQTTFDHLTLDSSSINFTTLVNEKYNQAPDSDTAISSSLRRELNELFLPYNQALERKTKLNLSSWNIFEV
eukprot:snap_masked-scaffold_42-processed-gene-2.27-mRNA-1 protein AED:1.00 eAED:1.00 QI:0/0/0/0/1/1/4/0/686